MKSPARRQASVEPVTVCVAPHSRVSGVHAPGIVTAACKKRGCAAHTSDWREPLGCALNAHRVEAALIATPLSAMIATRYLSEAHFCAYLVTLDGAPPLARQPRVAKDSVAWLRSQGYEVWLTAFLADWDTPFHVPWTPELRVEFDALWASRAGALATCGLYLSPKGARLIQPLATWLKVEEGEASLGVWLRGLVALGAPATVTAVHDWTRLMRTPFHVRADGRVIAPDLIDLTRMVAVEAPPAPVAQPLSRPVRVSAATGAARTKSAVSRPSVAAPVASVVPRGWEAVADAVGLALKRSVRAEWHRCYLALSGALLARGCPPEGVPAVIARAHRCDQSYDGWEALLVDRDACARGTVLRHACGRPTIGYTTLRAEYPAVAAALDGGTVSRAEAAVLAQIAAPAPKPIPVADAVALIRTSLSKAWGVTVIAAPPGTGKTQAVADHARTLPVIGQRAAPGARVAVSSPTHLLAKQTAAKLTKSLHLFSPPSHTAADGTVTCIYAAAAKALAAGGQSVSREFCLGRGKSPCEIAETCAARPGREGDEHANLVVGVHQLVGALVATVGSAGLMVIDEPGDALFSERVTLEEIDLAQRALVDFYGPYARAMAPALEAFAAWVRALGPVESEELASLPEAIRAGAEACSYKALAGAKIDPETLPENLGSEILGCVAAAIDPGKPPQPPLLWSSVVRARINPARAAELGQASRVLALLRRGLLSPSPYAARIDERSGERAVTLTGPNEDLALALRHQGPVVVIAADAALHLPAYAKILGYTPRLIEIAVADGAPIERAVLVCPSATRSSWLPRGVPDWGAIAPVLAQALAWASLDPETQRVGLIVPKEIHAALAYAQAPDASETRALTRECRVPHKTLEAQAARLRGLLATFPGLIEVGHYGALRGLDRWADFDATITLGDPRPNLGDLRDRATYAGLDAGGRLDALAAAELEQAHGRLRPIHRTRRGRQMHAGTVLPAGWAGTLVTTLRLGVGRRTNAREATTMTGDEMCAARGALGLSAREIARTLGVSDGTIRRYESGERVIPLSISAALAALSPLGE